MTCKNTGDAGNPDYVSGSVEKRNVPSLLHGQLTGAIRQTAFEVHHYFGPGFLEKVYETALAHRLAKQGFEVCAQVGISVHDEDGTVVGNYVADLLVERAVIVEVKAVESLTEDNRAQVLNYLKATGMRVGMVVNFGRSTLQVKRVAL